MKFEAFFLNLYLPYLVSPCTKTNKMTKIAQRKTYQSPFPVHTYTLDNGLQVMLSPNKLEPRIQTNIVVKAGSKHDPDDCTGLAHYFEHMMFKGSSKLGTINWEEESKVLQEIEALYEAHRQTQDPAERKALYQKIDQLSNQAANYAVPNEYDKIVSEIGAKDTNAYTWVEQTVYLNNIPSNQLANWLKLEAERFRHVALRLFHTELETVYEEFNITQDSDPRKVNKAINEILFPTHPYGTHTTIGRGEDLKAPSQSAIQAFFGQYYVPNNIAICLSGDFEVDVALEAIETYWGSFQAMEVPAFEYTEQPNLDKPVTKEVYGQDAPFVEIAWKLPGSNAQTLPYYEFITSILQNAQVGLIDWIKREQKVLTANAYMYMFKDYSSLRISAQPIQGQSLEAVKDILMDVFEKLKNGAYPDWIIEGIIKDIKLSMINHAESNSTRSNIMTQFAIWDVDWEHMDNRMQRLEQITKEDITQFIQEHISAAPAIIYKKQGEDPNVLKMEKPHITPLPMNKETQSDFASEILSYEPDVIPTHFLDLKSSIEEIDLNNGCTLHYQTNQYNDLFKTTLHWELGKSNKKEVALLGAIINYIFTANYSQEELQNKLFQKGLYISSKCSEETLMVSIQGLGDTFEDAILILKEVLSTASIDEQALSNIKRDIFQSRINSLTNKQVILRNGLMNYIKFGSNNPFTDRLDSAQLIDLDVKAVEALIHQLLEYPFTCYCYGSFSLEQCKKQIQQITDASHVHRAIPVFKEFIQIPVQQNQIYTLDFPMVQTDILFQAKTNDTFDLDQYVMSEWYNQYFGYGLSSIMFQEIREAKAYGYATYAYASSPGKKDQAHNLTAYLGTQPDKVNTAIPDILELLNNMPVVPNQMEQARQSILKNIESSRINKSNIYWTWLKNKKLGYDEDVRALTYEKLQAATPQDLINFHQEVIKNKAYNIVLMGPIDQLDLDYISTFGSIQKLSVEEIFGYSEEDIKQALAKL